MKRIISFVLSLILLVLPLGGISASAEDISIDIDAITTDLLRSAFTYASLFIPMP